MVALGEGLLIVMMTLGLITYATYWTVRRYRYTKRVLEKSGPYEVD